MSKAIKFRNNTYLDTSSISHNKHNFKDKFQEIKMNTGVMNNKNWVKICNFKFDNHNQGEFAYFKIFIGAGNNGNTNQNAYIDLIMQLGWTGSNDGRLGCNAILYPLETSFSTSNTNIKVISKSNIDYDLWIYSTQTYCKPNYIANVSERVTVIPKWELSASEPSGTSCSLSYIQR